MEQYQDIWKKGEVIPGIRECASRYDAIKKELKKYNRPFTVLDIGANLGYFSFRIAEDFPESTCVMIEKAYGDKLTNLANENNLKNIIVLKKKVNATDLKTLSDCEHFDVILALNIIHHIGDVDNSFPAIEKLGETIIIETPNPNDEGSCGKNNLQKIFDRVNKMYKFMGSFSRHTSKNAKSIMGVLEQPKNFLNKKYWDCCEKGNKGISNIFIKSDNNVKRYINNRIKLQEDRLWIHGINLRTFQYLNGTYPCKEDVITEIRNIKNIENHTDLTPWNLIISGKKLSIIDDNDSRQGNLFPNANDQICKIEKDLHAECISSVEEYIKR